MQNLPRLMLVLAVLVIGMVAALPFHHRSSSTSKTVTASPEDLVLRRRVNLQIGPGAVDAAFPHPATPPPKAGFTQTATIRAGRGDAEVPVPRRAPTPKLSDRFTRLEEETTVPAQTTVSSMVEPDPPVPADRQASSSASFSRGRAAMVRHQIVDGDSLPELALRYLGDRQRGGELYQLNRDVLENPDLLPIGCVIKIPFRSD